MVREKGEKCVLCRRSVELKGYSSVIMGVIGKYKKTQRDRDMDKEYDRGCNLRERERDRDKEREKVYGRI